MSRLHRENAPLKKGHAGGLGKKKTATPRTGTCTTSLLLRSFRPTRALQASFKPFEGKQDELHKVEDTLGIGFEDGIGRTGKLYSGALRLQSNPNQSVAPPRM